MKIELYTVDYCPYCHKALNFFKEHNLEVTNHDITQNETAMRQELGKMYNINGEVTVPQIIIDGQRIGGYSDLIEKYNTGKISL